MAFSSRREVAARRVEAVLDVPFLGEHITSARLEAAIRSSSLADQLWAVHQAREAAEELGISVPTRELPATHLPCGAPLRQFLGNNRRRRSACKRRRACVEDFLVPVAAASLPAIVSTFGHPSKRACGLCVCLSFAFFLTFARIGYAIAERLAQDGAKVVVSSRKEDKVNQAASRLAAQGLDVIGAPCHVGKAEDRANLIKLVIDKLGGIDILVSNAGMNPVMAPVLDTPEAAWDKIFDINVKSAFLLTKEIVPHLEKRGGGSIVYVSSIAAYQSFPLLGAYSVSKTALLGLTRAVAEQVAPLNIRVNCIAPGIIKTKFSEAVSVQNT
ncbi:hypothetical protein HPB51_008530 [Rhipicephalus microplus]|uniref:Dehydrogenase n=1 Tax=Rhipicephalus microplus TaxID=6941 RepID=A0A9J6ERS9_RHIMP|nr:hypothetical protein HPB51_008530 [Rhipicephalus microplus]